MSNNQGSNQPKQPPAQGNNTPSLPVQNQRSRDPVNTKNRKSCL